MYPVIFYIKTFRSEMSPFDFLADEAYRHTRAFARSHLSKKCGETHFSHDQGVPGGTPPGLPVAFD